MKKHIEEALRTAPKIELSDDFSKKVMLKIQKRERMLELRAFALQVMLMVLVGGIGLVVLLYYGTMPRLISFLPAVGILATTYVLVQLADILFIKKKQVFFS